MLNTGSPSKAVINSTNSPVNNQELIAVKIVEVNEGNTKEIDQYKKAMKFEHPNILRTLQQYEIKEYFCTNELLGNQECFALIPMEYIPKGRLTDICGKVKEQLVWNILSQLTSALAYIYYGDELVHRAVTPANILIKSINAKDNRAHVVLSHFNLMRHFYTRNTVSHDDWSTEAPEVSQGHYTAYSDVYSLGMTIYKLCLGDRLPQRELIEQFMRERNFSELLISLLRKMTDVNVLNRYTYLDIMLHCKLFNETTGISLDHQRGTKCQFKSVLNDISYCEATDLNNVPSINPITTIKEHFILPGQPVIVDREIEFEGKGEFLSVKRGDILLVHDIKNGWLDCQKVKKDASTPGSLEVGKVYYDLVSFYDEHSFKSICHQIN